MINDGEYDSGLQRSAQRKGCLFLIGRGLLTVGILLIGLAIVSASIEAIAAQADRRAYSPPGELVDVGSYQLHLSCMGEGNPTIILESGAGEASPMWGWIQPQLAASTRVCSYDRAGFGWSDGGPQPRHARQIVDELQRLLHNAGIQPPYLLAGHSLGGELVRLYAGEYPDEVVGLVFIDSSHPEQLSRIPELNEVLSLGQRLNLAGALVAPFGLMRLYWGDGGPNPDLPPQESGAMRAFFATSRIYRTQIAEDRARPQIDKQVAEVTTLGNLPLLVLSQDASGEWMALQEDLSKLSTNSRWIVVKGATHLGLLTDQQSAAETSAAIQELLELISKIP